MRLQVIPYLVFSCFSVLKNSPGGCGWGWTCARVGLSPPPRRAWSCNGKALGLFTNRKVAIPLTTHLAGSVLQGAKLDNSFAGILADVPRTVPIKVRKFFFSFITLKSQNHTVSHTHIYIYTYIYAYYRYIHHISKTFSIPCFFSVRSLDHPSPRRLQPFPLALEDVARPERRLSVKIITSDLVAEMQKVENQGATWAQRLEHIGTKLVGGLEHDFIWLLFSIIYGNIWDGTKLVGAIQCIHS